MEPHREMRESLVSKDLGGKGRGEVKVVDGNAAKIGLEEGWGDACVAAQVDDSSSLLGVMCMLMYCSGISLVSFNRVME